MTYRTRNILLGVLAALICLQAPLARAAAIIRFSVAPTDTLGKVKRAPLRPLAVRWLSEATTLSTTWRGMARLISPASSMKRVWNSSSRAFQVR